MKPAEGRTQEEREHQLAARHRHDGFVSYFAQEQEAIFDKLRDVLMTAGLEMFNQKRDLSGVDVNRQEMEDHARGSKLVLALLSPGYFGSKWCRAEVEAADKAGVTIVPVFSG